MLLDRDAAICGLDSGYQRGIRLHEDLSIAERHVFTIKSLSRRRRSRTGHEANLMLAQGAVKLN